MQSKFSKDIIDLGPPIIDKRLEVFEKKIMYILPNDFKKILRVYNGISLMGNTIYGLDKSYRQSSLDEVYQFEHYDVQHKMFDYLVPFSPDGAGSYYCLNLLKMDDNNECCPVVFWQWDIEYRSKDELEECNSSFTDWVKEVN